MDSSADDGPDGSRSSHPNYNTMTKAPTTAPPIIPARASHRSPPAGMVFVRSAVLWLSALLFVFTALVLMRRIVVRRVILKAPLLIPFPAIDHTRYSHDTCSARDSGCPPCPAGQGTSITLLLHLTSHARAVTRDLPKSAFRAQQVIWNSAPAPTSIRKTEALDDLHSSLSHWCCHTQQEHQQIVQLVTNMTWHPISLVLNQVGCSIDHDNRTVSLQAIYDDESQARLRAFIERIEKLVRDAGE